MRELPFSQIMLAPNAEHDLKIDALPHLSERSSGQKTKKFVRFVRTSRDPQCLERSRRGGDQQIGRGDGRRRLQMMLEEPDLIDADTFGELDFFELAPEHFRMCRIFARGRGRPDGKAHPPTSRFKQRRAAHGSQLVLWSAPRRVSSIALVLFAV